MGVRHFEYILDQYCLGMMNGAKIKKAFIYKFKVRDDMGEFFSMKSIDYERHYEVFRKCNT